MLDIRKLSTLAEQANSPYKRWMTGLNEATYYGKNKYLVEAEATLDEMIRIAAKPTGATTKEFSDNLDKVENLLATAFGFSDVAINRSMLCAMPQLAFDLNTSIGCTLPHSVIIKWVKQKIGATTVETVDYDQRHKGIRFKPGSDYSLRMFISPTLFQPNDDNTMTGGEILAIMLHEIGHNFYEGPVRELGSEALLMFTQADMIQAIVNRLRTTILIEGTAEIDENLPEVAKNLLHRITSVLSPVLNTINTVKILRYPFILWLNGAYIVMNWIMTAPVKLVRGILKYDSEKYSDAFATAYGYGTELSTALEKMEHFRLVVGTKSKSNDVFDFIWAVTMFPIKFLSSITDCHPNTPGRLANDIKYMRAAGDKIKDPRLKKEYEESLRRMEELRVLQKSYVGTSVVKLDARSKAFLEDLTHISDPKDLFSSLNAATARYKNLDYV